MNRHWVEDSTVTGEPLPWVWFFFLLVVFYFADHYESIYPIDLMGPVLTSAVVKSAVVAGVDIVVAEGSIVRRVALLSMGAFAVVSMLRGRLQPLAIQGILGSLILVVFFFALASVGWSEDLAFTLRRTVLWALFSLGALACARRFSLRELAQFACFSCVLLLVLGLYREFTQGVFHPFEVGYRFQGSLHPNVQGWQCATIVLSASGLALGTKQSRSLYLWMAGVGMVFLLLTKSRIGVGSTLFALTSYWGCLARPQKRLGVLGVCLLVPLLYFTMGEEFLRVTQDVTLLGRQSGRVLELGGRTKLWQALFDYAAQRPLLGYGFNGFWTPQRVKIMTQSQGWYTVNSHSGYLELILGVGFLAVSGYVLMLALAIHRATTLLKVLGDAEYRFVRAMLIFLGGVMTLEAFHMSTTIPNFVCLVVLMRLGLVQTTVASGRRARQEPTLLQ